MYCGNYILNLFWGLRQLIVVSCIKETYPAELCQKLVTTVDATCFGFRFF